MRRGTTLIEALACLAVVAIVAAIATPVFAGAKRSSLERQSVSNMRQVAMAAMVYRPDWQSVEYGGMEAMGLPQDYATLFGAGARRSGSFPKTPIPTHGADFLFWMPLPEADDGRPMHWKDAALQYRDRTVLVCDPWFLGTVDGGSVAWDPTRRNRINGIDLGGGLIRKRDFGRFYDFDRWKP